MPSASGVQILADHPFLPGSWLQERGKPFLPDVNPAAAVYTRLKNKALSPGDLGDQVVNPSNTNNNGNTSVGNLQNTVNQILGALQTGKLTAACSPTDPTMITGTITFTGLPASG